MTAYNPLEVLPETALAGVSEAGHLHEIDAFWYVQVKNHCLDEESLKTLCSFCSAIEGILDDFVELVKWHLILLTNSFLGVARLLKINKVTFCNFLQPVNTICTIVFDGPHPWSETCPKEGHMLSPSCAV